MIKVIKHIIKLTVTGFMFIFNETGEEIINLIKGDAEKRFFAVIYLGCITLLLGSMIAFPIVAVPELMAIGYATGDEPDEE